MYRFFVLFANDNGFIGEDNHFVNNIAKALKFNSQEKAEKHRTMIYSQPYGFQNTISILEWL